MGLASNALHCAKRFHPARSASGEKTSCWPYFRSERTICGSWFAWASMAVADFTMMLLRV